MAERKTPEQKLEELEKKNGTIKGSKEKPFKQSRANLKERKEHAALSRTAHLQKNIFVVKKSNLPTLKNCFKSWLRLTQ